MVIPTRSSRASRSTRCSRATPRTCWSPGSTSSLEDLLGVNEWTDPNQFPFPGTVILIPPGAKSVTAAVATTDSGDTSTDDEADATEATPTETIPDAGDNCSPGTYTIVEGDYLGKVASKFDVTVDALNAANVITSGYSSFYVGLEIVIPAKSDC